MQEEQLNRDRHRGQEGEQHCPFCRQPELDYIPVKFDTLVAVGVQGCPFGQRPFVSHWVQQKPQSPTVTTVIQTLTLTNESHPSCPHFGWLLWKWAGGEESCAKLSKHRLEVLCDIPFSSGCNSTEHNPFDFDGSGQGEPNHDEQLSTHPCAALPMDYPSHIYNVQEGFVPCAAPICLVSSPKFS